MARYLAIGEEEFSTPSREPKEHGLERRGLLGREES